MRLVRSSKLADKVLRPLEDRLVSLGYVGNVDVNCIVDGEGGQPWPLEFTVRFGYPAINIELALHSDPVEFLAGLAAGKPPRSRRLNEVAVGVVMALPPYPYREEPQATVGVPIWNVSPGIEDNLHLCMAQVGEGPLVSEGRVEKRPVLATAGGYVLVSVGTGESVVEAKNEAYRVLHRLDLPSDQFYRNDIGERLRFQLGKLQENGFAVGMNYA
jgi:phosphoribosylamine--glycine ligase